MLGSSGTLALTFWGLVTAINLLGGLNNALRPGQSQDLRTVLGWTSLWLFDSANPYALAGSDYPPNALVVLMPLAFVPTQAVAVVWTTFNLLFAPVAGWLAFRVTYPGRPARAALLPVLLFLSWAGLRIGFGNGQFHLFALVLGLAAVALADRRPYLAGVLLGMALSKPHFAIAFLLWAVLTRRFRMAITGLMFVVVTGLIFSARLGQDPFSVARSYLFVLESASFYTSSTAAGISLSPLIRFFGHQPDHANSTYALLVGLAFLALLVVSRRVRSRFVWNADVLVLALCCAFATLALFHNSYDAVLLVPLLMWLCYPWLESPSEPRLRSFAPYDRLAVGVLQAALVIEIPGFVWKLTNWPVALPVNAIWVVDTVVVAILFAYLVWRVLAPGPPDQTWFRRWQPRRARDRVAAGPKQPAEEASTA
jgi:Glycosyltransferase family 87